MLVIVNCIPADSVEFRSAIAARHPPGCQTWKKLQVNQNFNSDVSGIEIDLIVDLIQTLQSPISIGSIPSCGDLLV
jgi:hypothetical protein